MIICVLSIKVLEYPADKLNHATIYISKPIFVIATLIYPLADTLRIFLIRSAKGTSPFSADKNHLHHRLIECGLNHKKTVFIIYGFNLSCICISILSVFLETNISLLILIGFTLACLLLLEFIHKKRNPKQQTEIEFSE